MGPQSRHRACSRITVASESSTTAGSMPSHPGGGMGGSMGASGSWLTIRSPIAAPKPSATSVMAAPMKRLLPLARLRVASSISARVSENPGSRTTRAASVTALSEMGGMIHVSDQAPSVATTPARNSASAARSPRADSSTMSAPTRSPVTPPANASSRSPPRKRVAAMAESP
jgi:hypothetical protein